MAIHDFDDQKIRQSLLSKLCIAAAISSNFRFSPSPLPSPESKPFRDIPATGVWGVPSLRAGLVEELWCCGKDFHEE